ncbi:hypothetical protein EDC04DRAFT_2823088 [Pisolithus marmoratus]|nr:hypothetical protein EDC04DRAFT_2823088 [Pisolithus marmoratus]
MFHRLIILRLLLCVRSLTNHNLQQVSRQKWRISCIGHSSPHIAAGLWMPSVNTWSITTASSLVDPMVALAILC